MTAEIKGERGEIIWTRKLYKYYYIKIQYIKNSVNHYTR